jgi:hypothetical protein
MTVSGGEQILELPALAVQIGDELDDGQMVVGIATSYNADPAELTFTFTMDPSLSAPTTGVRIVDATTQLRVVRRSLG